MPSLRDLLADERIHVLDGAMGTVLYQRGAFLNVCYDELVLRQPAMVAEVHAAYAAAGAELLETNTFGANPLKLQQYGLADETEALNAAAARLARQAAPGACILGAIGPLGVRLEPFGELAIEEAEAAFGRQIRGLLLGGVDGLCLETFADVEELTAAIRAARQQTDLAVMAQMTIGSDGCTAFGTAPEQFGPALVAAGADCIGINCSIGPQGVLEAIERLARVVQVPLVAQPNAGLPRDVGDRKIYMASPEYLAEYARRMVEAGARFVGGCCGTTPEHIRAIWSFAQSTRGRQALPVPPAVFVAQHPPQPSVPLAERSRLGDKLATGAFITSVEIVPPRGADPAPLLAQAHRLAAAGVDAVNLPDGPRAQSRMGALISGLLIGMLSDLLGAAAAGLHNLLVVTGDPPKMGPYPDATAVFDIDAIGLTNLITRLNQGLDPGGNPIGSPTRFVHGVGLNPAAPDLERELHRFGWKAEAGATFAMTQPVFDPRQLEVAMERVAVFGVPIIAGVWPLVSLRNAEFLANEVPGVTIPDSIMRRMHTASLHGRDAALAEGVAIAQELIAAIRPSVAGVQVAAPMGRVEVALEVLDGVL